MLVTADSRETHNSHARTRTNTHTYCYYETSAVNNTNSGVNYKECQLLAILVTAEKQSSVLPLPWRFASSTPQLPSAWGRSRMFWCFCLTLNGSMYCVSGIPCVYFPCLFLLYLLYLGYGNMQKIVNFT